MEIIPISKLEQLWIPGVIVAHLIATLYLQWKENKPRSDIRRPRVRKYSLIINTEMKNIESFFNPQNFYLSLRMVSRGINMIIEISTRLAPQLALIICSIPKIIVKKERKKEFKWKTRGDMDQNLCSSTELEKL